MCQYTVKFSAWLAVVACGLSALLVYADQNNIFVFKNLDCKFLDPTYGEFTYCRLKAINRSLVLLTVRSTFYEAPKKHLKIHMQFFKKANGYKPFLINVEFDLCTLLKGYNIPVFAPFYAMIRPYVNVHKPCPMPAKFAIQNFPIKPEMVPSTWPGGEYRIDITFIVANIPRTLVKVFIAAFEKSK